MRLPFYTNEVLRAYFEVASEDRKALLDDALFDINPLTCKKEYLPLLALEVGAEIDGLSEIESREYIKRASSLYIKKGTVGLVKSVLNAVFTDATIKENGGYLFDVEVITKADTDRIYDAKKFQTAIRLLNDAKNVRSHLNTFKIRLPPIITPLKVGTFSEALRVHPFLNIDEIIDLETININSGYKYDPELKTNIDEIIDLETININSGYKYDPELKTNIDETITADDINLTGGYKWQVEV